MDVAAGLILLSFLLHRGWVFPGNEARRALFAFVAILLLPLLARPGFTALATGSTRPARVIDGAAGLGELFRDPERWELKDAPSATPPAIRPRCCCSGRCFFARGWGLLVIWAWPRCSCRRAWWPVLTAARTTFVGGLFLSLLAIARGSCAP